MDPASAVGLASACLSLMMKAASTANDLRELCDKFASVENNVDFLISKVNLMKSSVTSIKQWLDNSRTRLAKHTEDSLTDSLNFCTKVVDGIKVHVASVKQEQSAPGFKGRVRYLWNADTIDEHVRKLDSQINSLTLHLQVITLQE
jgi:hypothetical protein